jgi:hypothetical protein
LIKRVFDVFAPFRVAVQVDVKDRQQFQGFLPRVIVCVT